MIANLNRRLRSRDREIRQLEKDINDPEHRAEDEFCDEDGIPRPDPRRGVGPGTLTDVQDPYGYGTRTEKRPHQ
jgi:choline/glycine/proline betaine transport protein